MYPKRPAPKWICFQGSLLFLVANLSICGCNTQTESSQKQTPEKILEELSAPPVTSKDSTATETVIEKLLATTPNSGLKGPAMETPLPIPDNISNSSPNKPENQILNADVVLKEKKLVPITVDDPSSDWSSELRLPYQVWEMTFVGNAPAGYSSRSVYTSSNRESNLKLELESTLHVRRAGKLIRQKLEIKSTELSNGKLDSLSGSLVSGEIKREFFALNTDNVLVVESTEEGRKIRTEIPLADDVRGPFAVEQSLIRKPIRYGEIRSVRYFDPMIGKVVESQLEGLELSKTQTMLGQSMELLEVAVTVRDGDLTEKSTLWMNKDGRVIKSSFPALNLRVFQVDEKMANEFSKTSALQFVPALECPLELKNNEDAYAEALNQGDSVVYRLAHMNEDPTPIVSKRTNQRVRSVPSLRTCDVLLSRVVSDKSLPSGVEREINPPKAAKLSSEWCDTESPASTEMHASLTSDLAADAAGDIFLTVQHLRKAIGERYETIEFDREIRKFQLILRAKKLDSFEHALVLAAMCRKSNIPSRIAIGMVYNQNEALPGMRLHAWVEYFVKDRWYPVDSSQSSAKAELDRIKIRENYAVDELFLDDVLFVADWINNTKLRFVP